MATIASPDTKSTNHLVMIAAITVIVVGALVAAYLVPKIIGDTRQAVQEQIATVANSKAEADAAINDTSIESAYQAVIAYDKKWQGRPDDTRYEDLHSAPTANYLSWDTPLVKKILANKDLLKWYVVGFNVYDPPTATQGQTWYFFVYKLKGSDWTVETP